MGSWEPGERGIRNALMVKLAEDPTALYEALARAFDVLPETLRPKRTLYEEGPEAVLKRGEAHHKGGRPLAAAVRRRREKLFAQGKTTAEVEAALEGKGALRSSR